MTDTTKLPPLPEPVTVQTRSTARYYHTASQILAYGAECRRMALEDAAKLCDSERAEFSQQAAANNGRESDFSFGSVISAARLAAAIRALKDKA